MTNIQIQSSKSAIHIAVNILLLLVMSGCVGSEQNDLNILRTALEKDREISLKLVDYNRSIADEKTISFMQENFENRKNILMTLQGVGKSEKGALGKIEVEKFLNMENAYSESMGLASLQKQRAYAIGGTGYRYENSADRASENYFMRAQSLRRNLEASEENLVQYGWKKTWRKEITQSTDTGGKKLEKPAYVDGTQWQYLQEFRFKPSVNTESVYSWLAVPEKQDVTPSAMLATKHVDSVTMVVRTVRFFCNDRTVMVDGGVHVGAGYAIPVSRYSTSSPIPMDPKGAVAEAYKIVCEKKWWSVFSSLSFLGGK